MAKFDLLLTESEHKSLSSYAVKAHGGLAKCGVEFTGEVVSKVSQNAHFRFKKYSIDLEDFEEGELYLKDGGVHRSIIYPAKKEHLKGRSKFLLRSGEKFSSLDVELLPRVQRLFMEKVHSLINSRNLVSDDRIMVSTESFLIECDALLRQHYFVNKELDPVNSTSDAVFNFCIKSSSKGYKHDYWIKYLKSDSCIRDSFVSIADRLVEVLEKNPTLHKSDSEILKKPFLTREEASRLSSLVESSLIQSTISIKDDFLSEALGEKCGKEITVNGVVFGVSQLPNIRTTEYEIRVKTEVGNFVKIVSKSEYFGGLITKADLVALIEKSIPVEIKGEVISFSSGLNIAGKLLVPPSTNMKASAIRYDKSLLNSNISFRKSRVVSG